MSQLISAVVSASFLAYAARPLRRSALSAPLPRINFVAGLSISTVPEITVVGSLSAAGYRPLFALSGPTLLAGRSLSSTTSPPFPAAPSNLVSVGSEIKSAKDQIEAVVAEIKMVEEEIKQVEGNLKNRMNNSTRDIEYEKYLMDKKKQLRDKEKLLMKLSKQNSGKCFYYVNS